MVEPPPTAAEASLKSQGPAPTHPVAKGGAATIDGSLDPGEWDGLSRESAMLVRRGILGEETKPPTRAWLRHDGTSLFVAIENELEPGTAPTETAVWGQSDAVELAFQRLDKGAPILVLRGFANGEWRSSDEAGAPPNAVDEASAGTRYAAVAGPGKWTAEWQIPLTSLDLAPGMKVRFNLSVRKAAPPLWQMWHGTGAHTWDVGQAGFLELP